MRIPKIDRYLLADSELQPVVAKARHIGVLAKLCADFLPPELEHQVHAANLKEGKLVILAANPAAAAKLKLMSESLSEFLLQQGQKVSAVSVRVQPRPQTVDLTPEKHARLSPATLRELTALYQRLPDSAARKTLKSLLDHHSKPAPSPPPPRGLPRRARS